MESKIWEWLVNIPKTIGQFGTWLFTKLPYINLSPIAIFTIGGIGAILIFHLIKLVNPMS